MCALISAVHTHSVHTHGHTPSRLCAAVALPLVCQQAGLEEASRRALSLSGLCYHGGSSVAPIKAVFNKGGVCML